MVGGKKSVIGISMAVIFLLITGFGCKGLSSQQQAATKAVTLEYWTVFDDVDQLQRQIAAFKSVRPYLTVNVKQLRPEELYQRLLEALADDKGPDIISVQNRALGSYVSKLMPMPESVSDTTIVTTKTAIGTTDTQVLIAPRQLPNQVVLDRDFVQAVKKDVVIGGKIYGLPLSLDTMAIYYNKDILDKVGIPTPPKNWDEFQADVKKITRFDKAANKIVQSGVAFGGPSTPGLDDILFILFRQSGISVTDKTGRAMFNQTSKTGTGADSVLDFYTDFANAQRDTYTWDETLGTSLDAFVSGRAGFFFGYSYYLPIIKSRAPQMTLGIMPMLQLSPDSPINAANYWVQTVVNKSKHPNEAWDLIGFLTYSEANKAYLDATGRPTAMRANLAAQQQNPDLAPFVQNLLVAENWYMGKNYDAAYRSLQDLVREWLAMPPNIDRPELYRQNALDRAVSKINQTL